MYSATSRVAPFASSSTCGASWPMWSCDLGGAPRRAARAWSLGLLAALLSSCGFHLQGSAELPAEVRRVYVATADELTPFAVELREALSRNGATLAPAARAADAVVRVRSDKTGRRVLSVSARNTPVEFEVFYVVRSEEHTSELQSLRHLV